MIKLILRLLTKKVLLKFVLPVLGLYLIARLVSIWAAVAVILILIGFVVYRNKLKIFSWIGNINYYRKNIDNAIKWYRRAYMSGNAKPRVVASYAYLLLKSGNVEEAEKILNDVINDSNINKDDLMFARSNFALTMWKKGNLDGAIDELENIIENYENTVVYGSLGYMLIEKGDLERALEFNLKAYDYNDSNMVIMDNLGQTYYLLGEYDKAKEILEKLMEKNPAFPEAYYNYGRILKHTDDNPQKALEIMKQALDYKLSFLSTVRKEDIENEIEQLEKLCEKELS